MALTPEQQALADKLKRMERFSMLTIINDADIDKCIEDALSIAHDMKKMRARLHEENKEFRIGDPIRVYGVPNSIPDGSVCEVAGFVLGDEDGSASLMIASYRGAKYYVSKATSVRVHQ